MEGNQAFTLTQLNADDAKSLSNLMVSNQDRFQRFFPMTLAQNLTEAASQAFILLKNVEFDLGTELTFAIRERTSDQVAGLVILKNIDRTIRQAEIAYCIGAKYEGKGWTSNAVAQIAQRAFKTEKLKTLQILVHVSNLASIQVAKNCGFQFIKIIPEAHTPPNENPLDMLLYERHTHH
ncbi:GNAT family N-acetyltransferase [Cytophaga sp. FL35]|uniref:GNAT family N-acetyltransferase n=1 Tax=Cytophaga sp. FL35 TaxID=1904456 RepID=UPI001653B155|nr:GNAT family N-acetyltransferase [Cytophaga sp. FL35]MBC6997437.1 GNAT family N-acetyltransferase [Cytophaga sp. FL35]